MADLTFSTTWGSRDSKTRFPRGVFAFLSSKIQQILTWAAYILVKGSFSEDVMGLRDLWDPWSDRTDRLVGREAFVP